MKRPYLYFTLGGCFVTLMLIFFFVAPIHDYSKKILTTAILTIIHSTPSVSQTPVFTYIEVLDSCDFAFVGDCVNVRSGPGTEYAAVTRLRTGVVLFVVGTVITEGRTWYKIGFVHPLLYPDRVVGDWYVAADVVHAFTNDGDHALTSGTTATTTKRIIVDVSEEKLYAYDGDKLFMEEPISTGLELTPTARGTFHIFKMTPSRFMQGPIPGVSEQEYDLPGVPWDLYFTESGSVIHGAYWHNKFGQPWSHGCVNLPTDKAKELYLWADLGTPVTVRN